MANSTGTLNGVYYVNKKNYDTINSGTAINGVTSSQDKIFIIKEELNTVVNATTATVCTDYTSASYTWSGNQPATTSAVWDAINQAAGATYSLVFDTTNKKITLTPGKTKDNQGNTIASYPLLFAQGGDATVTVNATNSTVTICAASYSINTGVSDSVTLTRTAPGGEKTNSSLTINNIVYAQNAGDSTKLGGNDSSYYTNANNLNAGIIPSGRLSGTYQINVDSVDSVHADSATTSTNITNTYDKLVTGGAVYNFVTGKIASVYEYQGETTWENVSAKTTGNTITIGAYSFALSKGDVINITNAFDLNEVHYGAGTNIAWNGTSWDPLTGNNTLSLNHHTTDDTIKITFGGIDKTLTIDNVAHSTAATYATNISGGTWYNVFNTATTVQMGASRLMQAITITYIE